MGLRRSCWQSSGLSPQQVVSPSSDIPRFVRSQPAAWLRAAKVSDKDDARSPLRADLTSVTNSGFGTLSPRRLSEKALEPLRLDSSSPAAYELFYLQVELDHQCLQRCTSINLAQRNNERTPIDVIKSLAVILSGPLNECGGPERFVFQEVQLRALVAALALLHHSDVRTLSPAPWDKLKTNISARFQDITFQLQRDLTRSEKIKQTSNVYLVQLASQYLSFIKRGDSKVPSLVGPAIKILFASIAIASSQYQQTQQILDGFNQIFALRQKPQTKFQALCGLQEFTRLATSLARDSKVAQDPEAAREAAVLIVAELLEKVDKTLAEENDSPWPEPSRHWHKLIAVIQRGTPNMDRGWFYYGLLDCAAQLAALVQPGMIQKSLLKRLKQLIFEDASIEYRCKAMEVLMACRDTRLDQYRLLQQEIHEMPEHVAGEPGQESSDGLLGLAKVVRDALDDEDINRLRFSLVPPLAARTSTALAQASLDRSTSGTALASENGDAIETCPAFSITPTNASSSASTVLPPIEMLWQEAPFSQSRICATRSFSVRFPRTGIRKKAISYQCVKLSSHCEHAVFYNDYDFAVFALKENGERSADTLVFAKTFSKTVECILNAALADTFLGVVTTKRLLIFDFQKDTQFDSISHGLWDPSAFACSESESYFTALLGQRQGDQKGGYVGRIKTLRYDTVAPTKPPVVNTLDVPHNDFPKYIQFCADTKIITCITRVENRVLAWSLDNDFCPFGERFEDIHDKYTAETRETGLTSASVYRSPSHHLYILCSSAPSSERAKPTHKGEWSFIIPLPLPLIPSLKPRIRPPNFDKCIHDFEQFSTHRALRGGVVSSRHGVFAVLEETGRISVLPLESAGERGVRGVEAEEVEALGERLKRMDGGACAAVGFGGGGVGGGESLVAVDARGKVVVAEFEVGET